MKHLFSLLFVLGFMAIAIAQPSTVKEQPTSTYAIQLGVFEDNVKQADFEAIRSYAYIYKREGIVFVGGFLTEESAEPILAKIKSRGYEDAFVAARSLKKAKNVHIVQIATKNAGEPLNWKAYAKVGNLYTMPFGSQVRVVHGAYDDINDARVKLKEIQNIGYKDAFVKTVKDVQLNPVTAFETGNIDLTDYEGAPSIASKSGQVPTSYSNAPPNSVKRKSIIKLQEALKEIGTYGGAIDGLSGKGTTTGYDKALRLNRRLKSFNELAQKYDGYDGWEDVRLLVTMTRELNIQEEVAPITADLINNLPNESLTAREQTAALDWHAATWKNLEKWSASSQYNDQIYTALKVAYYRALSHLEEHFALQGVRSDAATALGVSVLRTLIGNDFEGFN
jgi:hypothetical protein